MLGAPLLIEAFLVPLVVAVLATPAAIRVASRFAFYDYPTGWKTHGRATPYLGGAAVLAAFLIGVVVGASDAQRLVPVVLIAAVMWAVGTVDDRRGVHWAARLGLELAAGAALWSAGLGWTVFSADALNLALSAIWVVAVVNALNLLDLMDGVAGTVAAVSAAGAGALALAQDDQLVAATAFSLSGACLGFLPYNLGRPPRIFLGDGGSMTIGFVLAAVVMAVPVGEHGGWVIFFAAGILLGLPLLDMGFRVVSRLRRHVHLLQAGPDSLANYLHRSVGDARAVAGAFGALQGGLCLIAIGALALGRGSVLVAWTVWFLVGTAAVTLIETRVWEASAAVANTRVTVDDRGPPPAAPRVLPLEIVLIAFIAISCGLSPFLYGFYHVGVWGPIALGMLAALLGLLIARPAAPRRAALLAAGALAGVWLWALLSTGWAESADQAMTDANRWLLYAALFGVLVLLLRDDRLGVVVIGAGAAAILGLGGYLALRMLAGSGDALFLVGRLHEPLGYVNGQAGYLLLGVWPLVALAERARRPLVAGAALAGATFLGALVLLGQTRAVVPAVAASALLMLVAVPGRTKRAWALTVVGVGIVASIGPVLDVYESVRASRPPGDAELRNATTALLAASAVAGAVWATVLAAARRVGERLPHVRRLALAPLALCVAVAGGLALSAFEDPVGKVRHEYRAFTELETDSDATSRFTSGAGNRYDYWRVAVEQFADNPLKGIGAGNYDSTYFRERRTTEDIRQAHSIELQTLGELGIVGGLSLAVFLFAIGIGSARRARQAKDDLRVRGLTVAAGGTFAVWLVHTSVDWLHLIPGLTGIALCSAAVLVGPWKRQAAEGSTRVRLAVVVVCGVVVLAGAVLVGRAALADRYLTDGRELLDSEPAAAISKARDSLRLNDEDLEAYYLEAAAWARLGDYSRARGVLAEATRREPHDFVTWALLGDLATRRGDYAQAWRDYRRALALNPRNEELVAAVREARMRRTRQ